MQYELVVVVEPSQDPKKAEEKLTTLLEKEGFHVSDVLAWGKKDLSYPINKKEQGLYYSMVIASETAKPQTLYPKFKQEPEILRSLVLKKKKEGKTKISKS